MGLILLTEDDINGVRGPRVARFMKKLLELWRKKAARVKRGVALARGDEWMKGQFERMRQMDQGVISSSMGR